MRLLYIHGFRSSSRSFKAGLLRERLDALGLARAFVAPDLPHEPDRAVAAIMGLRLLPDDTLVGSSLGGFYATWAAEQAGCRAVLLNPAMHPARDLAAYVGPQTGYHDDVPFVFEAAWLAQLRRYEVPAITRPERYFLMAAKGDELLDWREMVAAFPGARQRVLPGSDHGLSDFREYLDEVLSFARLEKGRPCD
jgi:predicted esterase YcpF (UPF0227 family)